MPTQYEIGITPTPALAVETDMITVTEHEFCFFTQNGAEYTRSTGYFNSFFGAGALFLFFEKRSPWAAGQIVEHRNGVARARPRVEQKIAHIVPYLEEHDSIGEKVGFGRADDPPEHGAPAVVGEKRFFGLVSYLALKRGFQCGIDIRWIGNDDVETPPLERLEKIAGTKYHRH